MDMPQQELIEKVARSMLRAVFDETEVDPETCDLNWRGNDIWRCDFEEMAKAALFVIQPQLDAADKMREALCHADKMLHRHSSPGWEFDKEDPAFEARFRSTFTRERELIAEAIAAYDEAKKGNTL